MTAIQAESLDISRPKGALARITRVVKLHFANPWPVIITPWLILGLIFLVNLSIWGIVTAAAGPDAAGDVAEGFQYSGSSFYIFVYMMVVAIMAVNATFAYALGFSATRRDYYLGTALTFVILAAIYTAAFVILGIIERATNGWWLNGRMFDSIYFGNGPIEQAFCVFTAFLFFFFVGAATGSVYVRWKANGMIVFFAVLTIIVLGGAALVTITNNWPAVGAFFANAGFVGSFAWSLVLTALAGVAGFFLLRRATPRSS